LRATKPCSTGLSSTISLPYGSYKLLLEKEVLDTAIQITT